MIVERFFNECEKIIEGRETRFSEEGNKISYKQTNTQVHANDFCYALFGEKVTSGGVAGMQFCVMSYRADAVAIFCHTAEEMCLDLWDFSR